MAEVRVADVPAEPPRQRRAAAPFFLRQAVIGLIAFLTVVDLFATQALLPSLAEAYGVSPAAMGTAVNACTLGMALAGLGVSLFGAGLNRRRGIVTSLILLAVPTSLLAIAPDLATFTALRVTQGLLMSTAFSLTLAHLAEQTIGSETAAAFAAYITGNVASNLFGRLLSASAADLIGLKASFYVFAALNVAGACLAWVALSGMGAQVGRRGSLRQQLASWGQLFQDTSLCAAFAIGFTILFAFIGTFTYVNFVLVSPPLSLGMMAVGLVYLVFLPSIATTPLAGRLTMRLGTRRALCASLLTALAGLPLALAPALPLVLAGLALVGVGTFLAQATTTAYVGRTAGPLSGSASGLYLTSYFLGGLAGSAVLGQMFMRFGWPGCVAGIAVALAVPLALSRWLRA